MSGPTNETRRSHSFYESSTMMKRILTSLLLSIAMLSGLSGCMDRLDRITRVQTNLVDKAIFEGEWWYTRTIIDLNDDAAYGTAGVMGSAPWPGAMADVDIPTNSGVMARIRWVVDENFLYAYRAYEIVPGAAADGRDASYRGSPVAAYRITGHFDVRQDYNSFTGEPSNTVSEVQERLWYDRQYVRVDWSQNIVSLGVLEGTYDIGALVGAFRRESASFSIVDQGSTAFPAAWQPQFVRVGEDASYRFRADWPSDQTQTVHYMSFVTREAWTPMGCSGAACGTSLAVTMRDAFLRVPPNHEYAVETLQNSEYDRFGIIRTEQRTYVRGGQARQTIAEYCTSDEDCGDDPMTDVVENSCDLTAHVCVGGLSEELAETDSLTYYRLRHNFYSDSLTSTACTADWQCNNRYELDGQPRNAGSVCDQAARVCTIPLRERPIRKVEYTLSPGYPDYLIPSAFEVVAHWNETFMAGQRALQGRAAPSGEPIQCQGDNPTSHCFCQNGFGGSSTAEEVRGFEVDPDTRTCAFRYNSFSVSQDGVTDPYDCRIVVGSAGSSQQFQDIAAPTTFGEYDQAASNVTQLRFEGEECMLTLRVNSCDATEGAACEQLGDIRYNMFNYVSAAASGFCGVMQPLQDPINGEAVVSPINMGGQCLDNFGIQPLYYWPLLRGETPEVADVNVTDLPTGEDIRNYFSSLDLVDPAIGVAPGPDDNFRVEDQSRPVAFEAEDGRRDQLEALRANVRQYYGPEARTFLRQRAASGQYATRDRAAIESLVANAMIGEGPAGLSSTEVRDLDFGRGLSTLNAGDSDTVQRFSPFSQRFMADAMGEVDRERRLDDRGGCMLMPRPALVFMSQYGEYFAHAFAGFDDRTARIRWAQAWHRAVMQHELGHGLGFEHNFAATFDRNHYDDGYYRAARDPSLRLPLLEQFDARENGGNADGDVTGIERNNYEDALRRVRHERNLRGLGNYTSASTMDYPGDLSDILGIGHYDRAALWYNYFNEVEAFVGDPRLSAPGTSVHQVQQSDVTPRTLWSWYRGGESCTIDADCPVSLESGGSVGEQAVTQRCVTNPRFSTVPQACNGAQHCVCSNFDDDFVDFVGSQRTPSHYPVRYMFCSNSRLNDISWCNTFDAGESFQEAVNHWNVQWQAGYLTGYFRRGRNPFSPRRATSSIVDATKIFQHLFFRYFYEPRFLAQSGPLGFNDQYYASADVMNWLTQIVAMPDVGSYQLLTGDPATTADDVYAHLGETLNATGSDVNLDAGQGFYTWSRYTAGNVGLLRVERAGVLWDKYVAMNALALRDWGLSYTNDERFLINFYDLFPVEMTEFFGGHIIGDDAWFAPRITQDSAGADVVQYVRWDRGSCTDPTSGQRVPCRGATAETYPSPPVADTSNQILRIWATIQALAQFPDYRDPSFERRLAVFPLGSGGSFRLNETQPDGGDTCVYRSPRDVAEGRTSITLTTGAATCTDVADSDYITYASDRLHQVYVAVKVRSRLTYNLEEEQIGFQFLLRLNGLQDRINELLDLGAGISTEQRAELTRLQSTIVDEENFLATLLQLQNVFGVNLDQF